MKKTILLCLILLLSACSAENAPDTQSNTEAVAMMKDLDSAVQQKNWLLTSTRKILTILLIQNISDAKFGVAISSSSKGLRKRDLPILFQLTSYSHYDNSKS